MPKCVHCGDFVLVHPEALRERPEVFRGFCLLNPGGHEYERPLVSKAPVTSSTPMTNEEEKGIER